MNHLIDRLQRGESLRPEEYALLIKAADGDVLEYAAAAAREVAERHFGRGIYIRGLIEVTSYCRNDCYYCGLRRSNLSAERYRLSKTQILECCRTGYNLGFRTFVLQGGEDAAISDKQIEDIIRSIRSEFADCAITLSLGERRSEAYRLFREAGADRYLLRHETADPIHYAALHPSEMSLDRRMECLHTLKELNYQTGMGMMIGSPRQTIDNLVEDIMLIERFRPEMIGIGPYIPQKQTPFANEQSGSIERTLMLISIFRLMFPEVLIPSTTALATLAPDGRERGILAGANVVMPNLSPEDARGKYAIYDNKISTGAEAVDGLQELERRLAAIDYHVSYLRGDYRGWTIK